VTPSGFVDNFTTMRPQISYKKQHVLHDMAYPNHVCIQERHQVLYNFFYLPVKIYGSVLLDVQQLLDYCFLV
jgi:hypothetical protein